MPIQGIDTARYNLQAASNKYADIQRQLDRYNKVFETYANASPETQMRAASVMRQALNEYNGLKKQQEENALRIYEAQSWVDYYNNSPQIAKSAQLHSVQQQPQQELLVEDIVTPNPTKEVRVIATSTPGTLNNNTPSTAYETNALDTDTTMNVSTPITINNPNTIKAATTPVGVTNIIKSQTPQYPNTTISPVTTSPSTSISWPNYGQGSVANVNTGNVLSTSSTTPVKRTGLRFNTTRRKLI